MPDLWVCCVKVGDKYGPEYVNRLAAAVQTSLQLPHKMVCATDNPNGVAVDCIPAPKLPGWWAKLGLFQEQAFGQVEGRILYLDLDVVITGCLDDLILYPTRFAMHRDFTRPAVNASAVIVLDSGSAPSVWKTFQNNPTKYMQRHQAGGDQEYLTAIHPAVDLLPMRWVVSYKRSAVQGPPLDARVVCFHGHPKPHECSGWVVNKWS